MNTTYILYWLLIYHEDDLSAYPLDKLVGEQGHERPEQIMESSTDAEQWKLEVERVAPQLKV